MRLAQGHNAVMPVKLEQAIPRYIETSTLQLSYCTLNGKVSKRKQCFIKKYAKGIVSLIKSIIIIIFISYSQD